MDVEGEVAFPEIFHHVRGLHCTVFGSAPGRVLPARYDETLMVCVNGSGFGLSRPADITVMGAQVCQGATRTCRHTIRNINGRSTDRVLWVHPGKMEDFEDWYRDYGFRWSLSETLTAQARRSLVKRLTGYELPGLAGPSAPSNGALAVLLTAAAGASRVDMTGFSFTPGHFYISGETARNHVNHDEVLFRWLAGNAPVFSADAAMRERFGFHLPPVPLPPRRWFHFLGRP